VRFLYTRDTWQIEYQDEEGKTRSKVSGLAPPMTTWLGESLSKEAYAEEMVKYKKRAMIMWNAYDKSSRPRFDLGEDA
jgi:hypothetical protein